MEADPAYAAQLATLQTTLSERQNALAAARARHDAVAARLTDLQEKRDNTDADDTATLGAFDTQIEEAQAELDDPQTGAAKALSDAERQAEALQNLANDLREEQEEYDALDARRAEIEAAMSGRMTAAEKAQLEEEKAANAAKMETQTRALERAKAAVKAHLDAAAAASGSGAPETDGAIRPPPAAGGGPPADAPAPAGDTAGTTDTTDATPPAAAETDAAGAVPPPAGTAAGTTGATGAGTGGATSRPPADTMTPGEHFEEFLDTVTEGTVGPDGLLTVHSDDKVTQSFNHLARSVAGGASNLAGGIAGTFSAMAKKDNPEGQAWLGLGGGLLGAMILNKLLKGWWDKMDSALGNIPIIGPLLGIAIRLTAFAALFMVARKGTHEAFNYFGQGGGEHADPSRLREDGGDADDAGSASGGGPGTERPLSIKMQDHTGTALPRYTLLSDIPDDAFYSDITMGLVPGSADEYAVQIHADNGATFAPMLMNNSGTQQGNMLLIPRDVLDDLENNKPVFEAIDHNSDGAMDSFKLIIGGNTVHAVLPNALKDSGVTFETLGVQNP